MSPFVIKPINFAYLFDWFKKRKPALSLQALYEQTLREAQELSKYHCVRSAHKFAEAQSLLEKIHAE